MEAKTIGKLITALRKANGMTQKDLAEKLNVSDKTVSRWERDEGSPDLATIPVLAEIFDITCDELLRGERKSPDARNQDTEAYRSPKGEKQRRHILKSSLNTYLNRSFISIGLAGVGLIGAMIGNLAFLRAYIGFFVGAIFFLASLVCQMIFVNGAFLTVSDPELAGEEADEFKNTVVLVAKKSVCICLMLFAATVPLLLNGGPYYGLNLMPWLIQGIALALVSRFLCGVGWFFLCPRLAVKGYYRIDDREWEVLKHNNRLKRTLGIVLCIALSVTLLAQVVINEVVTPWSMAEGTLFYDYDSFIAFMEQDVPWESDDGTMAIEPMESIYYDEEGNMISQEEALREELRISDGTPEGKLLCTYIHRNQSVVRTDPADTEDGLPIRVVTQEELNGLQDLFQIMNIGFIVLYVLEILATVVFYRKKRMK